MSGLSVLHAQLTYVARVCLSTERMCCKRLVPSSYRCGLSWCIAVIAILDFARCQEVRTVAAERELIEAFESKAEHIHIVSHLDLRACRGYGCSSDDSAWVYNSPSFVSLTVRCSAMPDVRQCAWRRGGQGAELPRGCLCVVDEAETMCLPALQLRIACATPPRCCTGFGVAHACELSELSALGGVGTGP